MKKSKKVLTSLILVFAILFWYPYIIANGFNAQYQAIDLTESVFEPGEDMSLEEKIYWIAYYITYNPQGVGIDFYTSSAGHHLIVGVETTLSLDYGRGKASNVYPKTIDNRYDYADPVNTSEQAAFKIASIERYFLERDRSINSITYGEFFTVCDPVNTYSTPGEYVNLNNSWVATQYTLDDVISLRLLT